ncbi:MAG: ATP-binding cassette domain-containing protein, partial [Holophagales bacterium]|nr:ATP-binding cassette domain-containing protein [Holophagales bacterium]
VRRAGVGQLLGRVLESHSIEGLASAGGFGAAVAVFELAIAALVLGLGASSPWPVAVLAAWLGVSLWLCARLYRLQAAWTTARFELTHGLVESMVGHRTRLAQEPAHRRHADEDFGLAKYQEAARSMDRVSVWLQAAVPRGWLVLGGAALAPSFVRGPDLGELGLGLGGTLLAYQALQRLACGAGPIVEAALAGRHLAGLLRAGAEVGSVSAAPARSLGRLPNRSKRAGEPMLEARGLTFRYAPHGPALLDGVNLRILGGDRILLEGASGGGKSTLAALLGGMRQPAEGLLLLHGLDPATLGPADWRRRVAAPPQFHHNYVLTGTFAFNLLMGRAWPPSQHDLEVAENLCRRLGLGPLLERMPAGLFQMVGETGWQLSHGERSRLFLARALLQRADVVILDESLGSLDPESRSGVLGVVFEEAPALLLIAHT